LGGDIMALVPWELKEMKHLRDLFDEFFDFEIMPSYKNRMLEIVLPKIEEVKPKEIEIKPE
jgi:hypothetical protein